MPTKVRKYSRHLLTEDQRLYIAVLTKLGGFSNRAIAARIYATPNPSDGEVCSVAGYKHRQGLSCAPWRNIESPMSVSYADTTCRAEYKKHRKAKRKA